jgi:CRP/FNR family cyclic AMP-dependent transcriptional regulator
MPITNTERIEKPALFSEFSDEDYVQLEGLMHKEISFGDYIYFEAQRHPNIYFIKTGLVRLGYLDEQGNKIVKDILRPGDFFGQISLQKENLNGEFAQAVKSGVSLCYFTVEGFNQLLSDYPKLAMKFTRMSGYRIRRFEHRLENLLRNDVKTRLKIFLDQLLTEVKDSARRMGREVRIPNYLTHEEVAQLIGTSRQTVTTLLSSFKEENICSFSRKEVCFFNQ